MTKTNQKKLGNKGFSLVELIVVIAIMAVLIGVLAPQFIKYVEKSRVNTDIQNMEEIKTAIQTYAAENGYTETSITIDKTSYTVTDTYIKAALTDAGLGETITLKSSNWGDIVVNVTADHVTVKGTNANGATLSDGGNKKE